MSTILRRAVALAASMGVALSFRDNPAPQVPEPEYQTKTARRNRRRSRTRSRFRGSRYGKPHQGKQECARRVRQGNAPKWHIEQEPLCYWPGFGDETYYTLYYWRSGRRFTGPRRVAL